MIESPFELRARSAVAQLWNWVGEQVDKQAKWAVDYGFGEMGIEAESKRNAYSNVRLYMRKFFAGLIDFDNGG